MSCSSPVEMISSGSPVRWISRHVETENLRDFPRGDVRGAILLDGLMEHDLLENAGVLAVDREDGAVASRRRPPRSAPKWMSSWMRPALVSKRAFVTPSSSGILPSSMSA